MPYKRAAIRQAKRAARRHEVTPPAVGVITVQHDAWCAHWRGGACDCSPTVSTPAFVHGAQTGPLHRILLRRR